MSISQIRKDIDLLKRSVNPVGSHAEYYILNAKVELTAKINQISVRLGYPGEDRNINAEELKADILARLSKRAEDPFFKRYTRGF